MRDANCGHRINSLRVEERRGVDLEKTRLGVVEILKRIRILDIRNLGLEGEIALVEKVRSRWREKRRENRK